MIENTAVEITSAVQSMFRITNSISPLLFMAIPSEAASRSPYPTCPSWRLNVSGLAKGNVSGKLLSLRAISIFCC
jgi:hypothetical protein